MARVRAKNKDMPEEALNKTSHHMEEHHLRPEQLGKIAARAGIEQLVAVHLPFDRLSRGEIDSYVSMIAKEFSRYISVGEDLCRY